jgi:anthranilate/para-aminobenzoate synthase component I
MRLLDYRTVATPSAPVALLAGEGWGIEVPLFLDDAEEVRTVPADRPDELGVLLTWLDDVAESGDARRLAVGWLAYEAGVWLEGSTRLFRPPERTPLACFALYRLGGSHRAPQRTSAEPRAAIGSGALDPRAWTAAVEEIREGIARGDVYQVNLTRRVTHPIRPDALAFAAALFADNPVPYALAFDRGTDAVVSNSPELFLEVDLRARRAASAPIKGTIARASGAGADADAGARLLASEKDAAEHVMIVDLIRNDLGRVAEPGAVRVERFRSLLTFRHLHHLESLVAARLREGTRLSDVLRATLPGGSITGAPKRAALGFIRRLEPCSRGPYTGAAGFVRGNGRAVFNVAIRTAIVSDAGVDYHAGGGIVWDSDAAAEWEETETKSRELAGALAAIPSAAGAADGRSR